MKKREQLVPKPLAEGEVSQKEFSSYQEMAEHAPDWSLFCNYQLEPHGMDGKYQILELSSMQVAHSDMVGGFMFSFEAPKDKVCFSIIEQVDEKACFEQMKLRPGMIVVFDDRDVYNFMSSAKIKLIDVSINKSLASPLIKKLLSLQQMYFTDTNNEMTYLLQDVLNKHTTDVNKEQAIEIETKIIEQMLDLIADQEPQESKFTKGEKIAIAIRDQVFKHMDGTLNTNTLAEQHQVTTQTLQNSFKSLFGYTPQIFLRLLKLNLVHHELYESNERDTTVSRIGQKWGFDHMGRLSGYYKTLFGETPSVTLKEEDYEDDGMRLGCVERKEELEVDV